MAIRGSLREASLPDVLQLLAMGKKSGCLSIGHKQSFGSIYFDKGRISYAAVVNRRDRLGDILVKNGLITRADLDGAVAEQAAHPERRIGEILVAKARIPREELHRHVRLQIEEAVYYLFTWHQGTFAFEPDVVPDEQDFLVSINPESLLLEGARRIDEWSEIEKRIPSFDLIYQIDRGKLEASDVALTAEQEALVPLFDGERDIFALVDESGLGEFEVVKAIYGLLSAGFVQRVGKSQQRSGPPIDVRIAEHRNLGVAFYRTAMYAEALREFRRVAELRPRDEHAEFFLGLVALRERRFADAVRILAGAADRAGAGVAVRVNYALALELSGEPDAAAALLAKAVESAPNEPAAYLARAALAVRRRDLDTARSAAQAADAAYGKRQRPAAWYHYAGVIAALGGLLDEAIQLWTEGTARHPRSAVLHNNLATAYERRGRAGDALSSAERSAIEDPTLPQAHKNMGDLQYRMAHYDEALEAYQRAIRLRADLGGDVYLKSGNIRYRRGETEEAARSWEAALALAPDNAAARNNLELARRLA
ncbi:MAG: DUF4388 domain-containing protein [Gemmatimonadaceae bacterium]